MNQYIKAPFTINIAGYCGSGKSVCIKYIVQSFMASDKFDCILVFSSTGNFTKDYEFLKQYDVKSAVLSTLVVEEKMRQVMKIQKSNRENNKRTNVLIICDDIFGSIKDSKVFKDLVSTHRHYNISLIFSIQFISGAATFLREICQYVIIFDQRTKTSLQACYENYFMGEFENFKEFKDHFTKKLAKYHFFFIDRSTTEKPKIMVCPLGVPTPNAGGAQNVCAKKNYK